MPKINTYPIVSDPLLTDKLIGTDVGGAPPNQTKNFTVEQLGNTLGWSNITTTITPAEMYNANASPIQLVPAPGLGKTLQVLHVVISMEFNSVAYNAGADFLIRLGGETFSLWQNVSSVGGININSANDNYVMVLQPLYTTLSGLTGGQILATGNTFGPNYPGANNVEMIGTLLPNVGDSIIYVKTTYRTLNVGSTI